MDNKNLILSTTNEVEYHYNSEAGRIDIAGTACHWYKENLNHEIVTDTSFDAFLGLYNNGKLSVVVNYEHNNDQIIGGIDKVNKESDGLWVEGHINTNIPYVRDWLLPLIEAKDLKSLSTEGFVLNGYNGIIEREDGSHIVKDMILTAVAVTSHPADWDAEFSVRNYIEEYKALKTPEEEVAKTKWYLI